MSQLTLNFTNEPDCLPTCDDVCLGYCQAEEPPPKPIPKPVKATKGLREWTVEEINQLPGVQIY